MSVVYDKLLGKVLDHDHPEGGGGTNYNFNDSDTIDFVVNGEDVTANVIQYGIDHNRLSGLQGGYDSEYYHLESGVYTEVNNFADGGTTTHTGIDNHISDNSIHIHDALDADTYLRTVGDWVKSDVFTSADYYTKTEVDNLLDDKVNQTDFDNHVNNASIHFSDVADTNTYLRTQNGWTASDVFTSTNYYTKTEIDNLLNDKANVTDLNNHINDTTIHFTMLDEDDFASNSDTQAATQQSIKAYVDNSVGALDIRTDHNTLDNLQGGTTNERYHLTNSEHSKLQSHLSDIDNLGINEVVYFDGSHTVGSSNLSFDGTTFIAYEQIIGNGGIFSSQNHRGIDKVVTVQKDSSTYVTLTFEDGILVDYSEDTV